MYPVSRRKKPPEDWQTRSGISESQLDQYKQGAIAKLNKYQQSCPDLFAYLTQLIKLGYPEDIVFLGLLHCAIQWSRGHMSLNCGGASCHGDEANVLPNSRCCTMKAMDQMSTYFEPFASLNMGYIAGAIGFINGNQKPSGCPTTGQAFERCPPIDKEQSEPVVEMLEIYLTFCNKTQVNAFVMQLAGRHSKVPQFILTELLHLNSSFVTVSSSDQYHAQFLRVPIPDCDYTYSATQTSKRVRKLSDELENHLVNECNRTKPEESLFMNACRNAELPMVTDDVKKGEALFIQSKTSVLKTILDHCIGAPDSFAKDGPKEVVDYAENHLDEIMQRKANVHCADDVMCGDILSNMGTNSWNKQLEEKGAEAMSSEMSRRAKMNSHKPADTTKTKTTRKRKRERERKKCSAKDCPEYEVRGGSLH